tara:strand:+ start:361 stop:642 length:282 start_codon:yes stop_codon:yes gene_type:complete
VKFEKSWSIGNAITLVVIMASMFVQFGRTSQEVKTIQETVIVQSEDIKNNAEKIVKLEKNQITLEKDVEYIKESNERMEVKINKLLDKFNIID